MSIARQSSLLVTVNALVWAAVTVVVVGAIYFGIASCGGYIWHKEFFHLFAPALAVVAATAPSQVLQSRSRKAVFLGALAVGYLVIEAAVAPFYPGPPQSLAGYASHFLQALEFGPCG